MEEYVECLCEFYLNSLFSSYCLLTNQSASCKFLNGCHSGLLKRSVCEVFDLCHSFDDSGTDYKCRSEMSKNRHCFELS